MWRGWILTRVCGKVVDVGKDREFDKFELTELFERGMTIERKFNCMG